MQRKEIEKELSMSYDELVQHLLNKYGKAQCDYFHNESCKSKNKKVARANEGLICHHIDEDKAIMLCNTEWAINNPFEWQKADRLVYCNILEHLMLHLKIIQQPKPRDANKHEIQGLGGVINYICPQINDYFNGYAFKREWEMKMYSLIENNFEDYIEILRYFLNAIDGTEYSNYSDKRSLSKGWSGSIVQKIEEALDLT